MLYIIRGLPGSGKSTTARILKMQLQNAVHYEADQYFVDSEGVYNFNLSKIGEAHEDCLYKTDNALKANIGDVIVSNTFTTYKELRPYFELAQHYGVKPQVITCQGEFGSIHGVPLETLERMKSRFDFGCVNKLMKEFFS